MQARGPACECYLEQLEQECEEVWKNGRQMCEEISLTGNHCINEVSPHLMLITFSSHQSENCAFSAFVLLVGHQEERQVCFICF